MKILHVYSKTPHFRGVFICRNVLFLLTFSLLKSKNKKNYYPKKGNVFWDGYKEKSFKFNEHKTRPNFQNKVMGLFCFENQHICSI